MKSILKTILSLYCLCIGLNSYGQETLPIYSDYLSDNVYLIHPSAAGVGNCGKIRLTARQQWAGVPNAPSLQTLSFHTKLGYNTGVGLVLFNDKNGFHSQKGLQATYAYHIDMSDYRFQQLSFGLSGTLVQNQSDQRTFFGDRSISRLIESSSYFNADFSMAYHIGGFSSYFTVKNLLLAAKNKLDNKLENLDLRNYLFSFGYYFGEDGPVQFEPSVLFQYKEGTGEKIADFNIKAYKKFNKMQIWGALSYRRSFDNKSIQDLQYITPIVGVNFNRFMFSYTYSKQLGDLLFSENGLHQVTIGFNVFCRDERRASACPNINGSF